MKTTKLILKGLLLYTTVLFTLLFIAAIDSIYDNGWFIQSAIICTIFIYTCYKLISKEEFEKITLYNWFNNLIKE